MSDKEHEDVVSARDEEDASAKEPVEAKVDDRTAGQGNAEKSTKKGGSQKRGKRQRRIFVCHDIAEIFPDRIGNMVVYGLQIRAVPSAAESALLSQFVDKAALAEGSDEASLGQLINAGAVKVDANVLAALGLSEKAKGGLGRDDLAIIEDAEKAFLKAGKLDEDTLVCGQWEVSSLLPLSARGNTPDAIGARKRVLDGGRGKWGSSRCDREVVMKLVKMIRAVDGEIVRNVSREEKSWLGKLRKGGV